MARIVAQRRRANWRKTGSNGCQFVRFPIARLRRDTVDLPFICVPFDVRCNNIPHYEK
jgi:hypothetical protein